MSKIQTSLESLFEKGERFSDETTEDHMTANRNKGAFERKYKESCLNYGFVATCDSHSPGPLALYNTWWPALQWSHETFKTASPQRGQPPCIKRQVFGVLQKKNVNTKDRSSYWRPLLHQMCLHREHHSSWLTTLLKLKSPLLLVQSWFCLLLRTFVLSFKERLQFKSWHVPLFWLVP